MADVPGKFYRATKVRTGVAPSSAGSIEGEVLPPVNPPGSSLNSVGLTMPSAFTVSNSPLTANGTIGVAGAGTVAQYIRGDGSLADFPESSGGGSSVSYYLNGSVDQGTIGGIAYKELSKVPILGAGTDFSINADGYIASFITDAGDPSLLEIPGGNWNFETYFSASSSGGTPTFYVELYKVSSGGTATLIASSSSSPEFIAFGTNLTPYFSTLAVPTTALALTDRLAIRYYVNHSGRTITMHTENNHLCQIITTFTTGLTALNGLTAQVQTFATGTSGTDFNISSATSIHTFNLPTANATNRGALSSADWSLFTQAYNDKINSASVTGTTTKTLTLTQQDGGTITASWTDLNTDAVTSVFGRTGAVVAANGDYTTAQVTESGNLYYTDARSRAALSFAAGSGAYNTSTGVITIPTNNNQITNGAGYITAETDTLQSVILRNGTTNTGFTISNTNDTYVNPGSTNVPFIYLYNTGTTSTSNAVVSLRTNTATGGDPILSFDIGGVIGWSMGIDNSDSDKFKIANSWLALDSETRFSMSLDGTAVFVGNLSAANLSGTNTGNVTIGTANGLSLSGQQLSLALASGSTTGALSSTDWNTFNSKQSSLTLTTSGTTGVATLVGSTLNIPNYTETDTLQSVILRNGVTNTGFQITNANNTYTTPASTNVPLIYMLNSGTTSTSHSILALRTNQATGGDPFISFDIQDVIGWTMGIDNSDEDKFKIATSWAALDSNTRITITTGGNVGIGTSSPTAPLHLINTSNGFIQRFAGGTSSAITGGIFAEIGRNFASIGTTSNHAFSIFTNDLDRLFITSGGNLLVGTTTDNGAKLQVSGTATFSSSVTAGSSFITPNSFGLLARNAANTANRNVIFLDSSNQISIGNDSDINRIRMGTASSPNGFRMYSAGNIGIGPTTTDFGETFMLATIKFGSSNYLRVQADNNASYDAGGLFTDGTNNVYYGMLRGTTGLTGAFSVVTGGSPRFNITSGGNVLIGTSTDNGAKLQVSNAVSQSTSAIDVIASGTGAYMRGIRVLNSGMNNGSGLLMQVGRSDNTRNAGQMVFNYVGDGSTSNYIEFGLFGVDQVLNITGAGNVGVGTITPSSKLSINGAATANSGLVNINSTQSSSGSIHPALQVVNERGNHSYGTVAEFRISNTSDGDRPSVLFSKGGTSSNWSLGMSVYAGGHDNFAIGYRSNYPISSWATSYLSITTGGNVLIGTTTDTGAKLEVNGSIRTGTLDGGRVSGFWKLGRAILGTQPSETYQIIVEINGQLYAIGAANI